MDNDLFLQTLIEHGYVIMFFLMWIEGPIVTLGSAFLASLGYFSLPAVLAISIVGDIVGDIVFYSIGRFWGRGLIIRYGERVGLSQERRLQIDAFFQKRGAFAIFFAKSTTGLCFAAFVMAGIARMRIDHFLLFSFLGGIVWSTILVVCGYFFGAFYQQIASSIAYAGWIVAILAITIFLGITIYKKRQGIKILHGLQK